jgi:hypothetical protein
MKLCLRMCGESAKLVESGVMNPGVGVGVLLLLLHLMSGG